MLEINKVYNEDCLIGMKRIPDKSIDMILCDLPYGTTACAWDIIIPFDKLWEQYKRVIKDSGAIVLTASQPFTTLLINSNFKDFKYYWIWDKVLHSNPLIGNKQPLNNIEEVCVFYKKQPTYNPQMTKGKAISRGDKSYGASETKGNAKIQRGGKDSTSERLPNRIIKISNADKTNIFHPTQKPVKLFEYLIKTYTNENELVLDNCIGSGTTAIASLNTNRNYIGFEMNEEYYNKAIERIENHDKALKCEVGLFSTEFTQGSLF